MKIDLFQNYNVLCYIKEVHKRHTLLYIALINESVMNIHKQNGRKIKVCFCTQKQMSPSVPQTVVKGKKIYLGKK